MVEDFFKLLSGVANLVFFSDGTVFNTKYQTWLKRQDQKYQNYEKVLDLIHSNIPIVEVVKILAFSLPFLTTHNDILKVLAKKYGTLTVAVTAECDTEIARFASLHPSVLAFMADDSDYLIYPGQWRYFSVKALNLKKLSTSEFSRTALRNHLKLNDFQIVVFNHRW